MASVVDRGRNLEVFVSSQSAFVSPSGAGVDYPVAAKAVRCVTASGTGTAPIEMREDKYGSNTRVLGAAQKRTAEASLEAYLTSGGSQTGTPPVADLLEASGWTEIDLTGVVDTLSTTGSTSTVLQVANGAGAAFTVGGCVKVEEHDGVAGVGTYQIRKITANDATGDPDLITVSPPLTFTPNIAGLKIRGGRAFKPNDSRDDSEDCLAIWIGNDHSADQILGWVPGSASISLGSDTAARVSVSGTGRQHSRLVTTTMNDSGGINSSVTTVVVADENASGGTDRGLNTYWQIGGEVVKLTAVTGTTWTIARGTGLGSGAATHSDGVAITPYSLTIDGTYGGSNPIAATSGSAVISELNGSNVTSLQVNTATIDCGFGVTYREDVHGDAMKVRGYTATPREVTIKLAGWTHSDTLKQGNILSQATTDVVTISVQQGSSEGSIVGVVCPQVRLDVPSLDRGAEEVSFEFGGSAVGTTTGGDEALLMFG